MDKASEETGMVLYESERLGNLESTEKVSLLSLSFIQKCEKTIDFLIIFRIADESQKLGIHALLNICRTVAGDSAGKKRRFW
jgi:hypothetical protein